MTYNQIFVLKFEEGSSVKYEFHSEQDQEMYISLSDTSENQRMVIIVDGVQELKGLSEDEASICLYNMSSTMTTYMGGEEHTQSMDNDHDLENSMPGLKPNGKVDGINGMNAFEMIFALPTKDLKLGETVEDEVLFPLNLGGKSSGIVGLRSITYERDTLIDKEDCALLVWKVETKGLENKAILTPDSHGTFEALGICYFDKKRGEYAGAKSELKMGGSIELIEKTEFVEGMWFTINTKTKIWRKND